MNNGDIVQVRQVDTVDHWIYAKVLNAGSRQVQVQHPGNIDDGKIKIMAAPDIRTKADLLNLVTTAQGLTAAPLTDAQINTLGATDGWVLKFKQPDQSKARGQLHTVLVSHYQTQANALT